jgi:Polysaccharide deacetylase
MAIARAHFLVKAGSTGDQRNETVKEGNPHRMRGSYGREDAPDDISRGMFAGEVGAPRLLQLFEMNGIKTSWFMPAQLIETFPDQLQVVADAGHEIGLPGHSHENPIGMTPAQEEAVLDGCIALITRLRRELSEPHRDGGVVHRRAGAVGRDRGGVRHHAYAVAGRGLDAGGPVPGGAAEPAVEWIDVAGAACGP